MGNVKVHKPQGGASLEVDAGGAINVAGALFSDSGVLTLSAG